MDSLTPIAFVQRFRNALLAAVLIACAAVPAEAAKRFKGPVEATVIEVLDGDTFLAEAHVWPGHSVRVNIRVRGIDAPEMKSRCENERLAALHARTVLAELLSDGAVSISNIGGAKYYGRVLADVATQDGAAVSEIMLAREIVRPYRGGKRRGWCG
jgi:endonuclease YncB( thermonuclease family)